MSFCDDARATATDKINAAYKPLLDELAKVIANMKKNGVDPTHWYNPATNSFINFVEMLNDLGARKDKDIENVDKTVTENCDDKFEFIQKMVDLAVAYFTDGLSLILPKHMTDIDVAQIIAGKPLGGPNSIFNEVRNGVFNSIGIGENNDLRKLAEHPVAGVGNALDQAKDGANKALEDAGLPFRF